MKSLDFKNRSEQWMDQFNNLFSYNNIEHLGNRGPISRPQWSPSKLTHIARCVIVDKDCIKLLSDSMYNLQQSLEEMSRPGSKDAGLVMSDMQTWVSSALTDKDTLWRV